MKYTEIKKEMEKKHSILFESCRLFWAFSNEQFTQGKIKYPLKEGEKYTSIGAGGFMPNSEVTKFIEGMKKIKDWEKSEIKKAKQQDAQILYELQNYECFYTGDISPVLERFYYSAEKVQAIYNKNRIKMQKYL